MNFESIAYVPPLLRGSTEPAQSESIKHPVKQSAAVETRSSAHISQNNLSDEFLLTETGNGSKDALTLLFRRYRRTVLNIAGRILKDPSEAEDLCQEVFLLLFQRAKLFDPNKGTAVSWIIQITYHRSMNRRKYLTFRQHYNTDEFNEEQMGAKRQPLVFDEIAARTLLNRIREQLSADQRSTLELHFFEGYSFKEIAEKTGQTLGNIRNHYYRGLERLRSNVFP